MITRHHNHSWVVVLVAHPQTEDTISYQHHPGHACNDWLHPYVCAHQMIIGQNNNYVYTLGLKTQSLISTCASSLIQVMHAMIGTYYIYIIIWGCVHNH